MSEACYSFPRLRSPERGVPGNVPARLPPLQRDASGERYLERRLGAAPGPGGRPRRICDGLDNDCDGQVDEQAECPSGGACVNGSVHVALRLGGVLCPVGQMCQNGWCLPDPATRRRAARKGAGWVWQVCQCIDSCKGVSVWPARDLRQRRLRGQLCYTKGCPAGEKVASGRMCVDPCSKVSCVDGDYCQDGRCFACATTWSARPMRPAGWSRRAARG